MANVATGDVIQANDHNSIVAAIKGTTGENLTVFTKGVDIVSASALVLGTDGNYWHVTGTVTITSVSTLPAGTVIKLEFDGVLVLTHNATSLILQGATNYTTVAGDVFEFTSEGSGNWRETGRGFSAGASALGAVPSLTLSTSGAAGSGNFFVRRNATIALFDTTAARSVAFGDVGTTGGVNFAAPRDHGHAFYASAAVVPSTGNLLTVASTNGNLAWSAATAVADNASLAAVLAGDYTLTTGWALVTGMTLTLLANTTYLVLATATMYQGVNPEKCSIRIQDTTNAVTITSTEFPVISPAALNASAVSCVGRIVVGGSNVTIQLQAISLASSSTIRAATPDSGTGNNATNLVAWAA